MKTVRKMIDSFGPVTICIVRFGCYICFCNVPRRHGKLDNFLYHIAFYNLFYITIFLSNVENDRGTDYSDTSCAKWREVNCFFIY